MMYIHNTEVTITNSSSDIKSPEVNASHRFLWDIHCRADSRFAPSQWETSLQSNNVSHWLGASLESALYFLIPALQWLFSWTTFEDKAWFHLRVPELQISWSDLIRWWGARLLVSVIAIRVTCPITKMWQMGKEENTPRWKVHDDLIL